MKPRNPTHSLAHAGLVALLGPMVAATATAKVQKVENYGTEPVRLNLVQVRR